MNWVYRLVAAGIVSMCFMTGTANAQVVFKGPTEGKTSRMNRVTLDKVDGDDLKIIGFVDGKPATESDGDFTIMKNLEDKLIIFILTDKEAVFTFIGATNKAGKTYLSSHTITIGVPKPPVPVPDPNVPPAPKPTPDDTTTLGGKLKAAYRVSPDAASLTKLIAILEEVNGQDYANYDQMEAVLAKTGAKFLPNNELRKLRDLIGDEITTKAGLDNRKKDIDKVKAVLKEAIAALKGL